MPALYILDTSEFLPLVQAAKASGLEVRHARGYVVVSSPREITIERAALAVGDAIWYGALTGGYEGVVTEFGAVRLRLVSAPVWSSPQS